MNRIIHRVGAFLAVLLMLWLCATGSTIQLIDLATLLGRAPPTDPTQLSIVEGMYGPGNYAVIQLADFSAAAFPGDFDISRGIDTVLQASHGPRSQRDPELNPMAWVDLRMAGGVPVGQIMLGTRAEAFDARTGASVAAVPLSTIPQGGRLPASLRQKLKTLHRFWNRADLPGVYFEFLSGLILLTLVITGLVMYFRLLGARARVGRREWFWFSGGSWRGLHRAVSIVAAAFLLCIAFSGTWIGFESSWSALHRNDGGGAGARRSNPIDFIIPLRDAEVQAMTATTLDAMRRLHPGAPIKALRLRIFGQMKQGVVITGGERTDQFVFNADTGEPASLSEPSYPRSNFPFGVQVHEDIKHFHSGDLFGIPARLMSLLAGLSLLFLSVSGLVVYFGMWQKRRQSGRSVLLWK